jgi:sulfite exporter TauE/SafE/copper chaperone CopZ
MTVSTAPTDRCTIRVTGMTCASCERRVERAVTRLPGVVSARASSARGRVVVTGELPPDAELQAAVTAAGYTVGAPPWLSRDRRTWTVVAVGIGLVGAFAMLIGPLGLRIPSPDAAGPSGYVLALVVGLAAGVSTCMALVGGLVLSVAAGAAGAVGAVGHGGDTRSARSRWWRRLRPQLVFTAGRIGGFAAGGALLGSVGSAAQLPEPALAVGALTAAAVMAVLGVRLTGLSPRLSGWTVSLPARWGDRVGHDRGVLLAGAATFVLPCGFTQAMQVYAISLGSAPAAAAVMALFAVGTTPGLLSLGTFGSLAGSSGAQSGETGPSATRAGLLSGTALPAVGVLVLAFALVNAGGGLRSLGVDLPALPGRSITATVLAGHVSENVRLEGGVQVVGLTQSVDGYTPSDTTVWAGVPIKWAIDITSGYACSSFVRIPALGVKADLPVSGHYVVDVPALKVGTTSFTCAMGMFGGDLRAIPVPKPGA